jgi:hypothetical protein
MCGLVRNISRGSSCVRSQAKSLKFPLVIRMRLAMTSGPKDRPMVAADRCSNGKFLSDNVFITI